MSGSESIGQGREVSLRAGEVICRIYDALLERCPESVDDTVLRQLNRFCVRLVFCLYAENAGLFAKGQFSGYLSRASDPEGKRVLLLRLFRALNVPSAQRDPIDAALLAYPHVRGGLFAGVEEDSIPLLDAELCALIEEEAAGFDRADISPIVFGGIFESTINPKTRRMGGMHYTSVENIHKVIDPLFLDDLKGELASILAKKEETGTARERGLKAFCEKLASLTFLDPACGAGNFLVETFISLWRLESEALQNLAEGQGALDPGTPLVSIEQFYGIESDDFAVAVAKTALWNAAAQMRKETRDFSTKELPCFLPSESHDNIRAVNALAVDWLENVPGRHIDFIISNPPFVGYSHKTPGQRDDMRRTLGHLRAWGKIDYVGAWFYRAARLMRADPTTRAAFVATNSIAQGEQASTLWKPLMTDLGVHIAFAYRSFKWAKETAGAAAVHCVIIGMTSLKPQKCTIFDEGGNAHSVRQINNYLVEAPCVFVRNRSRPLCAVPIMTTGNRPADGGHLTINASDYGDFIVREPRAKGYIKRFMGAAELLRGKTRYCLWLKDVPPDLLRSMPLVSHRLERVKAFRIGSTKAGTRGCADTPALFQEIRQPRGDYLAIPEVSSSRREYVPIALLSPDIIPSNKLYIIPDADIYHFGILISAMHAAWMRTVAGRLGVSYQYSGSIVYNNFPWPTPTNAQRTRIGACARDVLSVRAAYPQSTLADLYDPLLMPPDLRRAHKALDVAVDAAYGLKFPDEVARVTHLFALYEKLIRTEHA